MKRHRKTTCITPVIVGAAAAILILYHHQVAMIFVKATTEEGEHLQKFMNVDRINALRDSWKEGEDPCLANWRGVTCQNGSVFDLKLENMQLVGNVPADSLSRLTNLRRISLKNNNLTGPLPNLTNSAGTLLCIWLQDNHFTGPIPDIFSSTSRLRKLYLARNNLTGQIPPSLASVRTLIDLHLESNNLSGTIPAFNQPGLRQFDVSSNHFNGSIPQTPTLSKFSPSSFQNNDPSLCGPPTSNQCPSQPTPPLSQPSKPPPVQPPTFSKPPGTKEQPPTYTDPPETQTQPLTSQPPKSRPPQNLETPLPADFPSNTDLRDQHVSKASRNTIIAVAVPALLVVLLATLLCIRRAGCSSKQSFDDEQPRKSVAYEDDLDEKSQRDIGKDERHCSRSYDSIDSEEIQKNVEKTRLIFFREDGVNFPLEELLRASAEMLGKGSFGATYKAIVGTGPPLAVKRFRGDSNCGRREFDQHMQTLGQLNHPHLLPLRAYSYAKDQHLLVSDFMPNGNLFALLHGDRRPDRTPLTWPERLKLALLIGRALSYLHQECHAQKIPHGNVKSTNVLLDQNREPRLCDFGLVPVVHPSVAAQRMTGFKDPEYLRTKKITHEADAFSFGVLILELLTGKIPSHSVAKGDTGVDLPRWVSSVIREEWTAEVFDAELGTAEARSNEEMVNLLQVGLFCVAPSPHERPKLMNAVQMIEEIQEIQSAIDRSLPTDPHVTPAPNSPDHATRTHEGTASSSP